MVTEWGMSDKLGPLAFGKRDEMIFLGREIGEQRNYSDDVAKLIDEEVRALIEQGYARATQVLTENKTRLLALADKLIAEETVEADEFEKLFSDLPPKENLHGISLLPTPGSSTFSDPTPSAPPPTTTPSPSPSPSPS
jgi:cell division protease FtsH